MSWGLPSVKTQTPDGEAGAPPSPETMIVTRMLLVLSGAAAVLRAPVGFESETTVQHKRFVLRRDSNSAPTGMTIGLWNNADNTTLKQARAKRQDTTLV